MCRDLNFLKKIFGYKCYIVKAEILFFISEVFKSGVNLSDRVHFWGDFSIYNRSLPGLVNFTQCTQSKFVKNECFMMLECSIIFINTQVTFPGIPTC